jgi:TPR repeat protein
MSTAADTKKKVAGGDECGYCGSADRSLKSCSCRLVGYCSEACQTAHWKATTRHSERCIAPKDRKPSAFQPEAKNETDLSKQTENDLCGICFEPLLSENVSHSGASLAGTQTLVCKHSFHLKCASDSESFSSNPLCPLCRGSFSKMPKENMFLDPKKSLGVISLMVDKGQITWATLPPTVQTKLRSTLRKLVEAANCGHALAQCELGYLYYHGHGVKQDYKTAAKWFHQSADQGYASAQFNLGIMYSMVVMKDDKRAAKLFHRAADQGHVDAQHNLGVMNRNGQGVKQDDKTAAKWFRQAAGQGHAESQSGLGDVYFLGQGVMQDDKKAAKWFHQAAVQGHAEAEFKLGAMYLRGQGVAQDHSETMRWIKKAAGQGQPHAVAFLSSVATESNKEIPRSDSTFTPHQQCESCGRGFGDGLKLKPCSRCKLVVYCGEVCQRVHWKGGHKARCSSKK